MSLSEVSEGAGQRRAAYERLAPGWYRCFAEIKLRGSMRRKAIECHNPAYGLARLEEWADALLKG